MVFAGTFDIYNTLKHYLQRFLSRPVPINMFANGLSFLRLPLGKLGLLTSHGFSCYREDFRDVDRVLDDQPICSKSNPAKALTNLKSDSILYRIIIDSTMSQQIKKSLHRENTILLVGKMDTKSRKLKLET